MAEYHRQPVTTRYGTLDQRYSQNVTLTYLAPDDDVPLEQVAPESHGWFVVYYSWIKGNQVESFLDDYDLAVERFEELVKSLG